MYPNPYPNIELSAENILPLKRRLVYGATDITKFIASDKTPPEFSKMVLYMVGDTHTLDNACTKPNPVALDEFLIDQIKTSPAKTIDLFLEIDPYGIENNFGTNFIVSLSRKLYHCLGKDKSLCNYEKLRAHYTDMRHLAFPQNSFLYHVHHILLHLVNFVTEPIFQHSEDKETVARSLENFKEQLGNGSFKNLESYRAHYSENGISMLEILQHNIEFMESADFYKITKQIDNAPELIREKLRNILHDTSQNRPIFQLIVAALPILNELAILSQCAKETLVEKIICYAPRLREIHRAITGSLLSKYMDVYLLARIFRTYKTVKFKRSLKPAKNVIILAGKYHLNNYELFFKNLGFVIENRAESSLVKSDKFSVYTGSYDCVYLRDFNLPFFSNKPNNLL